VEPPTFLAAAAARQLLDVTHAEHVRELGRDDPQAVHRHDVERWRAAVAAADDPRQRPSDVEAAALVVSLLELPVRDEVLSWAANESAALLGLLRDLAARTVPPYDAPVCTVLAAVAWSQGDGALANVALDRAARADPGYSLAALLREGLAQQVPPSVVRRWLRATRQR
jgi:hypothetical protein